MARFLVSAAHKSSGKTTVSIGLCAALTARGQVVQAFKKGPDYIDPMWLAQASGRPCFNLDPYLMTAEQISASFARFSAMADISLVEGNKGLYDGLALDGSNSNAALAHLLDLPVVLVLDARGMTRGIAPLILGYQAFDARIRIAGVILNQLGGSRHEAKLRAVIEHYTNVSVLGAIAHDPQLALVERHLGLMPNQECDDAANHVQSIGQRIAEQVDLGKIIALANSASPVIPSALNPVIPGLTRDPGSPEVLDCGSEPAMTAHPGQPLRLGILRDKAFGFYYPDDLLALQAAGAELVTVNALQDSALPAVDGLFIGGGFPEVFMPELQANAALRSSIKNAIEVGLPVYAECGGLMYLARTLRWKDTVADMVGALPVDVLMHERPVGRGYVTLQTTPDAPWLTAPEQAGQTLRGHEFHYSSLENVPPGLKFAYRVLRGHGSDGQRDGVVYRNVLASYAHLRTGAGSDWANQFVNFVRRQKMADQTQVAAAPRSVIVKGQPVATDVEGYLKNLEDWSEDFARAQAAAEDLTLTEAHWQVIYFLRAYYEEHRVQAQVRAMIPHFAKLWGPELGNNHHLHTMFPVGGPQKQGNRLAGLLKTKGEH
jgi:cobyrinic acid a,c-diamide synthase